MSVDCGDIADLAANGATQVDESQCEIQCPGDPIHLCGGGLTMSLYTWNGDVNVWHTPTNKGYYEVRVHPRWSCHILIIITFQFFGEPLCPILVHMSFVTKLEPFQSQGKFAFDRYQFSD